MILSMKQGRVHGVHRVWRWWRRAAAVRRVTSVKRGRKLRKLQLDWVEMIWHVTRLGPRIVGLKVWIRKIETLAP